MMYLLLYAYYLFLFCDEILSQSSGNIDTGPRLFGAQNDVLLCDSDGSGNHFQHLSPPPAAEITVRQTQIQKFLYNTATTRIAKSLIQYCMKLNIVKMYSVCF